jgi:hypothetical protein
MAVSTTEHVSSLHEDRPQEEVPFDEVEECFAASPPDDDVVTNPDHPLAVNQEHQELDEKRLLMSLQKFFVVDGNGIAGFEQMKERLLVNNQVVSPTSQEQGGEHNPDEENEEDLVAQAIQMRERMHAAAKAMGHSLDKEAMDEEIASLEEFYVVQKQSSCCSPAASQGSSTISGGGAGKSYYDSLADTLSSTPVRKFSPAFRKGVSVRFAEEDSPKSDTTENTTSSTFDYGSDDNSSYEEDEYFGSLFVCADGTEDIKVMEDVSLVDRVVCWMCGNANDNDVVKIVEKEPTEESEQAEEPPAQQE